MAPFNAFIHEHNVEIYLDRLHREADGPTRDMLLRLLVEEQSQMPGSQEHLENGERRLADVRARLERQRHLVAGLTLEERTASQAILLLDTLQRIQALLETHCRRLRDDLGRRPP